MSDSQRGGGQGGRGGRGGSRGGGAPQPQRQKFSNNPNQPNRQDNQQQQNQQQNQNQNQKDNRNGPNNNEVQENGQRQGGRGGGRGGHQGRGGFRGGRPEGGRPNDMNESRGGGGGGDRSDRYFTEKILAIGGPTLDLPPIDTEKKEVKFKNNCRLYIGNISQDVKDDELLALFKKYGETDELFTNKEKMFGFIRMDYKHNADKAKAELDGHNLKGKTLKIRFAPINASIKVRNLTSCVTNELLELAFGVFGDIEKAIVIVDERGNSKGEGIVEFARKPAAAQAIRRCAEGCFFLTQALRPVIVEPLDLSDDVDGLSERTVNKKNPEYYKQRQVGPRFATVNSFEFEFGSRWKQLYEMFKQKEEALQRELKMEEEKLEAQMEYAKYEHETEMLRKELMQREQDRERQKAEWEMKERQAEEIKRRDEELLKKHSEEMQHRIIAQEEEMRRRQQENSMFMSEQQQRGGGGGLLDDKGLIEQFDLQQRGGSRGRESSVGGAGWSRRGGNDNGGGRWGPPMGGNDAGGRRGGGNGGPGGPIDFQSKRRRY